MQRVPYPMGKIRNGHYYYAYYSRVFFFLFRHITATFSTPKNMEKKSHSTSCCADAQSRSDGACAPLGSMGNLLGEVSGCVRGASRPVFRRQRVQSSKILYETSPNAHTRIRRIPNLPSYARENKELSLSTGVVSG